MRLHGCAFYQVEGSSLNLCPGLPCAICVLVKGLLVHGCCSARGEVQVAVPDSLYCPVCWLLINLYCRETHRYCAINRHINLTDFYSYTQSDAISWHYAGIQTVSGTFEESHRYRPRLCNRGFVSA